MYEVIYQTRETVFHRDIQTPRRELKIGRAAEYFWRNSKCFYNIASRVAQSNAVYVSVLQISMVHSDCASKSLCQILFPTFSLGPEFLNEAEKENNNGKGDSASAPSRFASLFEGEMQQINHFTVVFLVSRPLNGNEAEGDLVLIQTLLLLLCKSSCSYAN